MTLVRLLARPLMSASFIAGGINSLQNVSALAEKAEPVTDAMAPAVDKATSRLPVDLNSREMVIVNGVVHVVGGAMLATGKMPRLASLALAATLVPTTLAGHRFWEESDPAARSNQRIHFFKNLSMLGGLMLASVDTEGRPGLAWRAKHSASNARDSVVNQASRLTSH